MNIFEIKRLCDVDSMSFSKLFFVLFVLFVFVGPIFVSKTFGADSENVVASVIEKAENSVVSAYEAILDAEQIGANVSDLLAQLNVAGICLANARAFYALGDFENATHFANLCYDIGEEVRSEAVELKNEVHKLWVNAIWLRMTTSIVGVIFVVFLSFLVWGIFKRRYQKRILGMKPEVVSGES